MKKKGVKVVTILILAFMIVIQLIQAFAPTMPVFLLSVVLLTISTVSLNLCSAQTLISNWFPRKKGVALGWATAGMCLSGVILVPVCNAIVNNGRNQTWPAYVLIAGIAAVLLILTLFIKNYPEDAGCLPDNEPITEEERLSSQMAMEKKGELSGKQIARCSQTWFLLFGFGILFMGLMGVVIMTIPRLTAIGVPQGRATALFSIATVLGFVGSVIWGYIDQKFGTKRTSIIFGVLWVIMLAACSASALMGNIPIGIVSVFLFGCLYGGLGNLFPSAVIWVFGRKEFPNVNRFISAGLALVRVLGIVVMSINLAAAGQNMALGFGRGYLILTIVTVVGIVLICCLKQVVPSADSPANAE